MCHTWTEGHMELQTRTRMSEKGRVVIPAAIREALGMVIGDTLDMRVVAMKCASRHCAAGFSGYRSACENTFRRE